jgi:hypothetical protein
MTNDINDATAAQGSFLDFLRFAFDRSPKTIEEIAHEIGYASPNTVKLMVAGITKVPIDRIPRMAEALNVEPSQMMRAALEDYAPSMLKALEQTFDFMATPNEREIINVFRHLTNRGDPRMTPALRDAIEAHFEKHGFNEG